MTTATLYRASNRRYEMTFPNGRTEMGYEIYARGANGLGWGTLGFVVQVTKIGGKPGGWIVLDHRTGEVLLDASESTRIGDDLGSCLFMYAEKLASDDGLRARVLAPSPFMIASRSGE